MRGISAFLAAMIMIAIVSGIGFIMSGYMRGFAEKTVETAGERTLTQIECSWAGMIIDSFEFDRDAGQIDLWIRNTGTQNLESLTATIWNLDGSLDSHELGIVLRPGTGPVHVVLTNIDVSKNPKKLSVSSECPNNAYGEVELGGPI